MYTWRYLTPLRIQILSLTSQNTARQPFDHWWYSLGLVPLGSTQPGLSWLCFKVVIAGSFGDIHYNNEAFQYGMLPIDQPLEVRRKNWQVWSRQIQWRWIWRAGRSSACWRVSLWDRSRLEAWVLNGGWYRDYLAVRTWCNMKPSQPIGNDKIV